jgi:LysR family transcriptional regulator, regulator for metE and metH
MNGRGASMDLEIRHLKLLVAVSEEGSLTGAARRLHLTQSALSHQLRDAERGLGRPLFLRGARKMTLTSAGDRLLKSAKLVLDELATAREEIRESPHAAEGTLRLATECYTCYHWLPPALAEFQKTYPKVDVQVVAEATRDTIPALLDGRIDVAITSDPIKSSRVAVEPLFGDDLLVMIPAGHRLAKSPKPWVDAEDIAQETLITYDAPKEDLTVFKDVLVPAGLKPRRWVPIQITEAIVELVRAGQGISVMACWAAEPYAKGGRLVLKQLTKDGISREWVAATRARKNPPPYLAGFIRTLFESRKRPRSILVGVREPAAAASVPVSTSGGRFIC